MIKETPVFSVKALAHLDYQAPRVSKEIAVSELEVDFCNVAQSFI